MKALNRIVACILLIVMLTTYIPVQVFASEDNQDQLTINNGYIQYSINKKTGGFSISTLDGHPQKKYDNNIPLLFKEDTNSTETSFTTVRLDGQDYIFGQDYGWFGIDSKLYEPIVSNVDKTIITKWVIKGVEVTQKVAISGDKNNDLSGNAGIVYEVKNTNPQSKEVGIRVLLDTALGKLDSPYMIAGYESMPTIIEREFKGADIPDQIRGMDSITNPAMMNYAVLKGWSGGEVPDKVIIGHWGNLANSKYDYTPDKNCDFSNYSSKYKTPDSALAFFWSEQGLAPNETRKAEFLYGIGNFSSQLANTNVNINMDVDRIYTTKDNKAYENDGIFEVRVEIDNTVDNAVNIGFATLSLAIEKGLSVVEEGIEGDYNLVTTEDIIIENIPAGTVLSKYWRLKAEPQTTITAKEIAVSITTTTTDPLTSSRYVILPSVIGDLPNISFDTVTPSKFYTLGDKNINIKGNLEAFKSLAGKTGWDLYLRHEATGELIKIEKEQIAFTGDNNDTLSFTTNKELAVGKYEIVFTFIDNQLVDEFTKEIVVKQKIEVNLDKNLENKSYGILTVLRYKTDQYKFVLFVNEEELKAFRNKNDLNDFYCYEQEMLIEVRGKIQEFKETVGKETITYYAADSNASDVTINNVVQYQGKEPLILKTDKYGHIEITGNGDLSIVDNFVFWKSGFRIDLKTGFIHTLMRDKVVSSGNVKDVLIEYTGIGKIIQNIHGATIDIKYGELTESWSDNTNKGREGYAINFGGKIMLTFLSGEKKDKSKNSKPDDKKEKGEYDDGTVTANIENILYGESKDEVEFLGINASAKLTLPKRVFGGFIENVEGIYGELTINTLDDIYAVAAGVKLYAIECTGKLQIKIVEINDVKSPIPDEIQFYLSTQKGVPLVPPYLTLTGFGGGYSNLADSLIDNYVGSLPPITLHARAGLRMVEALDGDFSLALSLQGMNLSGIFIPRKMDKVTIETGIQTRWVEPWYLSMYGELDAYEAIKGGISVTIADNYFYGYGYVKIFIPKDIPIVGGKELYNVEAAVSKTMIGMNIKVLFVKLGVVYYWDSEEVDFGDTIDLGGMDKFSKSSRMNKAMYVEETPFGSQDKSSLALYGTNVRRLSSSFAEESKNFSKATKYFTSSITSESVTSSISKNVICEGEDALIFAIPYTGSTTATVDRISLINPDNNQIKLMLDKSLDGGEEGNFLVQNLDLNNNIIYISVTDSSNIKSGIWTVNSYDSNITINNFEVNAVDNIPELTAFNIRERDITSSEVNVSWNFDKEGKKLDAATVNIYLTKNKDDFQEAKESKVVNTEGLGVCIGQYPARDKSATVELPDALNSGNYYIIAVLAIDDCGPSILSCNDAVIFKNTKLPGLVDSVIAEYGGNGTIRVNITDPEDYDSTYYTYYNVYVTDESGNIIDDIVSYFEVGTEIVLGGRGILNEGHKYKVFVQTVKVEGDKRYISDSGLYSNIITMPNINTPTLLKMENNIDNSVIYTSESNLKLKYTFDQEVNLKILINDLDYIKLDEYKSEWEFETVLPDGQYIIRIVAVNKAGDSYAPTVNNAMKKTITDASINPILAFTVDTIIPLLRIGSHSEKSLAEGTDTVISNQTVVLDNGVLFLTGMTEAGSNILLDNSSQGITVQSDGSFIINRTVNLNGAIQKDMLLTVVDKAGNRNSTTIYVVDEKGSVLKDLNIKLLESGVLNNIELVDGYKTLNMNTGQTKILKAVNSYEISKGNTKDYLILPEQLNWEVIYGSNLIDFSEGEVYAKAPGEVVIKSSVLSAGFKKSENSDEQIVNTEDVLVIKITGDPVYDLPDDEPDSDSDNDSDKTSSLQASLKKIIEEIGEENIIKTISLQSSKQESITINNRLSLTIPIYSVDRKDILVLYRPNNAEVLKGKTSGEVLEDTIRFLLVTGQKLKKPMTIVYDHSKDNISSIENVGFYRFNPLFDKWEYVLSDNNTVSKKITANIDDINGIYTFIYNPSFTKFNDLLKHWSEKYVYALSSLSIINGVKEGSIFKFYPDKEITRAEFVKLVVATRGLNPEDYGDIELPFADTKSIPSWAVNYIKAGYSNGWFRGKSSAQGLIVDASANITREEAATILYRIKATTSNEDTITFIDSEYISQYAKEAIENFASSKIIDGYKDGSFRPLNNIKRGEAAKVIYQWINR